MPYNQFSAPIPGENYTSDTKNYPWHRPPEHSDLDSAIEDSAKKLLSPEGSVGVITMMEMGIDVATLTDLFLTSGIGAGKWTVDQALLIAGPVSHIMCLMAKGYGIKYNLGIETSLKGVPSKAFFDGIKTVDKQKAAKAAANVDVGSVINEAKMEKGGFMKSMSQTSTNEATPPTGTPPSTQPNQGGGY